MVLFFFFEFKKLFFYLLKFVFYILEIFLLGMFKDVILRILNVMKNRSFITVNCRGLLCKLWFVSVVVFFVVIEKNENLYVLI